MSLDTVVRRAIRRAPCTIRALARDAEVSHVMLQGIVTGRERATERVALNVARALETWASQCKDEAVAIRAVIKSTLTKGARMRAGRRKR
jgi:hypothetical protein